MKLHKILEQTVPGLGYELVDVEITPTKIIKVFIEKDGGVTIDDCEKVSNHLGNLLFVEEIEYNRLEISSPGLERPLKHLQDFIKFTGKQKVFQGIIKLVDGNDINLELSSAEILKINFDNISRARLVFELQKKIPTRKK
jgi:ribosome maturation factor RimP